MYNSFIVKLFCMTVPKKKQTGKIKIAVIIGVLLVVGIAISSYFTTSSTGTQSEPISNISFGNNREFPKSTLQSDGDEFFIDMIMENRGNTDARTIFTVDGHNAKVRIGTITDWDYKHTTPFTSKPDSFEKKYPLYVLPDDGVSSFTVMISLETPDDVTAFQEIALHHPSVLTFEKDDNEFVLTEQR